MMSTAWATQHEASATPAVGGTIHTAMAGLHGRQHWWGDAGPMSSPEALTALAAGEMIFLLAKGICSGVHGLGGATQGFDSTGTREYPPYGISGSVCARQHDGVTFFFRRRAFTVASAVWVG